MQPDRGGPASKRFGTGRHLGSKAPAGSTSALSKEVAVTRKSLALTSSLLVVLLTLLAGCTTAERASRSERRRSFRACSKLVADGFRPVAHERAHRFLGKVAEKTALCRGGDEAAEHRDFPWVDWSNYWATGDESTRREDVLTRFEERLGSRHVNPNGRGVDGALLDLEYQRIELIKFNLFDNSGTYEEYVRGRDGVPGPSLRTWSAMRLPEGHPSYSAVGGEGEQVCSGDLVRFRTVTGICNDVYNPAMGSTGMPFARNVSFGATYPERGANELARNRHGDRIGLMKPDPAVVSRTLLTRAQSRPEACNDGKGLAGWSADAHCDYEPAPFFNVLAAFWIQFMTHDWFSHLEEGHNRSETMAMGCVSKLVDGEEVPLTAGEQAALGCDPADRMERAFVAESGPPSTFEVDGAEHLSRAYETTANTVTAWWDASQLYGYDAVSRRRVRRDPEDRAKLLMVEVGERHGAGEAQGYLPLFAEGDPIHPAWSGQEATAFPDNWTIGLSFLHNVFTREHNLFVEAIRTRAAAAPDADSGLRDPAKRDDPITWAEATDDEIFEAARLVVAALIAKIHTIEWTTQLLYDEPLYLAMNANWSGLFEKDSALSRISAEIAKRFADSDDPARSSQWYSVFASGAGIVGLGSRVAENGSLLSAAAGTQGDVWSVANPDHFNGGVNHFGSPFNFPEEFVTVYRLHGLVPDLIEYRDWADDPNAIRKKVPVVATFRGPATEAMRDHGLASWGMSLGRQRLGALTLQNHARFHQNLEMKRLDTPTRTIDVAALDLMRDRERGVPRFNEFRRQYGLRQLTSFDDFVDQRLPEGSPERAEQERLAGLLREVYGQHRCDDSKPITDAQVNADGSPITDCLGHPDGTMVDNVEDVDTVVGWLSEFPRPHGFAISETQFQVFILNASRRLFSDRFFTSSFRPEFYSHLGIAWVTDNGPDGKVWEEGRPNGHRMEASPFKRVLLRTVPELEPELRHVVNAFDPWARDRGTYYSLAWTPRPGAESDPAFGGE